ncbi:MAG TPA: SUF system Fe-S cluster assembly protein [Burkholderiaceae bacterium]|jgi:FeS assembly SUF system protein|nr:SUF system Fe-S cluster assembly protein [Burkholderiaceae bacterium]
MNDQTQSAQGQTPVPAERLRSDIIAALRTIYDPELPVNIYDLGLIYNLEISPSGDVAIDMTLTAPGCPVANSFPSEVEGKVCEVPGVNSAHVELVWDPPWSMNMLSEETRLELGLL